MTTIANKPSITAKATASAEAKEIAKAMLNRFDTTTGVGQARKGGQDNRLDKDELKIGKFEAIDSLNDQDGSISQGELEKAIDQMDAGSRAKLKASMASLKEIESRHSGIDKASKWLMGTGGVAGGAGLFVSVVNMFDAAKGAIMGGASMAIRTWPFFAASVGLLAGGAGMLVWRNKNIAKDRDAQLDAIQKSFD